jgi:hypothetical protein
LEKSASESGHLMAKEPAPKKRMGRPREVEDAIAVNLHVERRDIEVLRLCAEDYEQTLGQLLREVIHDQAEIELSNRREDGDEFEKQVEAAVKRSREKRKR